MEKNIFFNIEVKGKNSKEVYKQIEKMNGVIDISEYLEG